MADLGAGDAAGAAGLVDEQLEVLAEARRVLVPQGLGVAERLEQRVAAQHLLRDPAALPGPPGLELAAGDRVGARRRPGYVLHDLLGGLRLAGAGLARDEDRLAAPRVQQAAVRVLRHREDMRRELPERPACGPHLSRAELEQPP